MGRKKASLRILQWLPVRPVGRRSRPTSRFTIDASAPVEDGIMDAASFEKFLHDKIKVNGKAGQLGDAVSIARDKTKIHVSATIPFSKRYLKYLTKKYLKKNGLREFLRVVAVNKSTYDLRYFAHDEDASGSDSN